MPLTPTSQAEASAFIKRKKAQWENFAPVVTQGQGGVPVVQGIQGLTFMQSGERAPGTDGTEFWLEFHDEDSDFYEKIVFGRLPLRHKVPKSKHKLPQSEADWRDATPAETPLHKHGIDLTDDQIDAVLGKWVNNESAADLPFISSVWRRPAPGKPVLEFTKAKAA
jgi:hypothetical protein